MSTKTFQQREDEIGEQRLSMYEGRRVLGGGSYGSVYLVWSKEYQQEVVLKEVAWEDLNVPAGADVDKVRSQIAREVKVLKDSEHDHIIGFVESFAGRAVHQKLFPNQKSADAAGKLKFGTGMLEEELKNAKQVLCIVMSYADGGDLEKEIKKAKDSNTPIAEERIWKWVIQITTAMGLLHSKKVLHRDIKPANILLAANDDAVIADLGIAKQLAEEENMAQTNIGTPFYMCPEIMDDKEYDGKCDMWALGCVIHELMTLEKPFQGAHIIALMDAVKHVRPPSVPSKNYSWALRAMCKWLLQKDPKYRPDAYNLYSYCLRNFAEYAITGADRIPFIRDESIPWKKDDLMEDEGKLDLYGEEYIGMTFEERKKQREEEEKKMIETGTLQSSMATQQALFDKNRLFKLGASDNSGGSLSPNSQAKLPQCLVVVGKEHEEEEAKHAAATKSKKKSAPSMQALKRAPPTRTAASKASPNNPLPRSHPNGPQKRPTSAGGRAKQICDDKPNFDKIQAHAKNISVEPKKSVQSQIMADLVERMERGELESYADICQYSAMAARGAIRFEGVNPWKDYNTEPETVQEQEELTKFILAGEERVTWGALRVRRDLTEQFGMAVPGEAPSAAN